MSVSQLVDDLNCIVSLSPSNVIVHELKTGKVIGIGKRNEDLYRLEQGPSVLDAKASSIRPCLLVLLKGYSRTYSRNVAEVS
jgi:hypothetical protein